MPSLRKTVSGLTSKSVITWSNLRWQKYAFRTQHTYYTYRADRSMVTLAGCCDCWSIRSRRGRTNANAIAKTKKKTRPKILLMTTLWRHQVWSHSFSLWRHVNEAALDGCCHGNGPMPVLHPSSSFFWFLHSPSVSYLWLWTSTWSHVLHKCRRWQLTSSSPAPARSAQCSVTSTAILHLWELASAWTEPSCQDVFKASHHDKVWDNKDV